MHMNVSELRARMISNVYALLGIYRMSKTDLARALGWDGATITRLLNEDPKKASREWKMADVIEVGRVFELDDPFVLTRPLNEVVQGWDPNLRATGTSGDTLTFVSADWSAVILPFPQVTESAAKLAAKLPVAATILPFPRGTVARAHSRPSLTAVGE